MICAHLISRGLPPFAPALGLPPLEPALELPLLDTRLLTMTAVQEPPQEPLRPPTHETAAIELAKKVVLQVHEGARAFSELDIRHQMRWREQMERLSASGYVVEEEQTNERSSDPGQWLASVVRAWRRYRPENPKRAAKPSQLSLSKCQVHRERLWGNLLWDLETRFGASAIVHLAGLSIQPRC